MIRLLFAATLVGGLLRYVFGEGLHPRRRGQNPRRSSAGGRKPARRATRREARPSAR
jgi:hypothetical protein